MGFDTLQQRAILIRIKKYLEDEQMRTANFGEADNGN
jgi:hypothetical protein